MTPKQIKNISMGFAIIEAEAKLRRIKRVREKRKTWKTWLILQYAETDLHMLKAQK